MLKKIGRILILVIAVLVIVLSVGGIIGAWGINSAVSNITLKLFSVVQTGTEVVDTAASRVDALVQTARSEVQQASEMITTAASNLQENRPVLTALSERLETRLGPTVD
jgi:flagellar basal body-associated protein FliL